MPGGRGPAPAPGPARAPHGPADPAKDFVSAVLGGTEDVWGAVFQASGTRYEPPRLVMFRRTTQSACGYASAAAGPFYCSADRRLYLDSAFFDELARRFGAPGDFAQAYVIAHEVGHHVQNVRGDNARVARESKRAPASAQELSVRLELQADCLAGVWAHEAQARRLGSTARWLRAGCRDHPDGHLRQLQFQHGRPGPVRRRVAVRR